MLHLKHDQLFAQIGPHTVSHTKARCNYNKVTMSELRYFTSLYVVSFASCMRLNSKTPNVLISIKRDFRKQQKLIPSKKNQSLKSQKSAYAQYKKLSIRKNEILQKILCHTTNHSIEENWSDQKLSWRSVSGYQGRCWGREK